MEPTLWTPAAFVDAAQRGTVVLALLIGALGLDVARRTLANDGAAFQVVFAVEAAAFVLAALLAVKATGGAAMRAAMIKQKREVFA